MGGDVDISSLPAVVGYSRSKGLFAGVDLKGSSLSAAQESNENAYGKDTRLGTILFQTDEIPDHLTGFQVKLQIFAP